MAWRTTEDEVRASIDNDAAIDVAVFIERANALTDKVSANDSDSELSTAQLREIETCLSAHFYARRDPQYQQKKTGDASATFQGQTGMGLLSTYWGQDAVDLDTTGYLYGIANHVRPKATWLGKKVSDQTDYVDRD